MKMLAQFDKFIGMTLEEAWGEMMPLAEKLRLRVSCVSSDDKFMNIDMDEWRLNVDIDKNGKIKKFTRG